MMPPVQTFATRCLPAWQSIAQFRVGLRRGAVSPRVVRWLLDRWYAGFLLEGTGMPDSAALGGSCVVDSSRSNHVLMWLIISSANSLHLTFFAPSMSRAKS